MKRILKVLFVLLLLFGSIGSSMAVYNDQLEQTHTAQRQFNLMQSGSSYYFISSFDQKIINKVEIGVFSWSDLGVKDEDEYTQIVEDCLKQAALNELSVLEEGNINKVKGAECREALYDAESRGIISWDEIGYSPSTIGEMVEHLPE